MADAMRCCGGRCRRAQPPMVMRGGLTDRWYVVLRYKDLGDGNYEAIEKHELSAVSAEVLDRLTSPPPSLRHRMTCQSGRHRWGSAHDSPQDWCLDCGEIEPLTGGSAPERGSAVADSAKQEPLSDDHGTA